MIGAVDIGGTKIAAGIVNDDGKVLASLQCPTDSKRGFADAMDRTESMLRQCAERAGGRIDGIGIGSTGPVDPITGEIGDTDFLKEWKGFNPVVELRDRFGVSVAMENDADAAALGEAAWGAGQGRDHMIFATFGTGIGAGILIGGKLYRGAGGSHPEIGHAVVDASGWECYCGARGCWEVLAAGPAMTRWMLAQDGSRGPLTGKQICDLARNGDPLAMKAVEREAYYLGLGLANLVTYFIPEVIVLGGSVMQSADLFMGTIQEVISRICTQVPRERVELRLASLGPQTGLIGAARVWHHRFA